MTYGMVFVLLMSYWITRTRQGLLPESLEFGPFGLSAVMDLVSFERCPNEGNSDLRFIGRQSRVNRSLVVENANVTFKVPLDDNVKVKLSVAVWGNGGWRPNDFLLEMANGCTEILNFLGDTGRLIFKNTYCMHLPNKNSHPEYKCPIPPGNYVEKEVDVKIYRKLVPKGLEGRWRLDAKFLRKRDNQLLGCLRRELRITPRKVD